MRAALSLGLAVALCPVATSAQTIDAATRIDAPRWELYATEYARSEGVSARRLIRGADAAERVDMSWYFFVAVGHGRVVLIDCGTDRFVGPRAATSRRPWSVVSAVGVVEALARLGLEPSQVTDVVLTHHHWDHVDGLRHFTDAVVHVHRGEWSRIPERLRRPVERANRLDLLDGSTRGLFEGVEIVEAGRHTRHQLVVDVACDHGAVALVSDAAYLDRNIREGRAVAVSANPTGNVADVAEAVREHGEDRVVPGHEPAIFERYPGGDGVAVICGSER